MSSVSLLRRPLQRFGIAARAISSLASINRTVATIQPSSYAPVYSHHLQKMSTSPLEGLRVKHAKDIERLVESVQANKFVEWLNRTDEPFDPEALKQMNDLGIDAVKAKLLIESAFMTFLTHIESRTASATGQGFYTIGPCGEELLGAMALFIRPTDAMALHYRHISTQIARQLLAGRSTEDILLDRARGHTVSVNDPVAGGVHCCIGGGEYDFLVTSTLASQATPAVGRAMGSNMATFIKSQNPGMQPLFPSNMVSFVSLGDGSANNAHFLSAVNLSEYAAHRKFKCPTVFCITDNDVCISLRGHSYIEKSFLNKLQMPVFRADGKDTLSVAKATQDAMNYSRTKGLPCALYINNITRRFGHAATDRQAAYLPATTIQDWAETNPMESLSQLLSKTGVMSYAEQQSLLTSLWEKTKNAFNIAAGEPKITSRQSMLDRVSVPLAPVPAHYKLEDPAAPSDSTGTLVGTGSSPVLADRSDFNNVQSRVAGQLNSPVPFGADHEANRGANQQKDVMRKHMTRFYSETLSNIPNSVYIGEDVEHGGYYLVSEGLAEKFPHRVRDFPPDETSLLGIGVGMAQNGLLPIVEIPYAKYLDCGFDMFTELALSSWLSGGKQPNGMIIRLQGVGSGVFGGNFHTHNVIYTPNGIDVVCYSNGRDYAMGMRYAAVQAAQGRVVMTVDSTSLLNLRHVEDGDDMWRKNYTSTDEYIDFDTIRKYDDVQTTNGAKKLAIVTYGEGVIVSLKARNALRKNGFDGEITIIDSPLLSRVPEGLKQVIGEFDQVVFADPCKEGQQPLANHICKLQQDGLLPAQWRSVGAQPTYNPLGNLITFMSVDDIVNQVNNLNNQNTESRRQYSN